MKTFFTIFLFFLLSASTYSYGQSRLSVTSTTNTKIRVQVDGRKYNTENNSFTISNIRDGQHSVKVYQLVQSRTRNNKMNGYVYNYVLVYNAQLNLRTGFHTDIIINRFGKSFVDQQQIDRTSDDMGDDDWAEATDIYDGTGQQAMNPRAFIQLKETLQRENFEDARVKTAKQAIAQNFFTAEQVKELIGYFKFEANRLEMAKYLYDYTNDKKNYFIVSNALTSSLSKEELMRYIETKN